MPIRILHIIGQIGVGGCEKQLLELCRRIDHDRYELAVCYYSPCADNMIDEFNQTGARLYYVNKFGGISLWRFFQTLRGFIRDFKPDIIHTWQYSPNCWGRLAGLSCGYKRFICSERSAIKAFPKPLRVLELLLGRRTTYTVNTAAVADALQRSIRAPRNRIHIIHNAVDLPDVDPAQARAVLQTELGIPPLAPIVLTVGRLTEAKNYPMFFRVAQQVLSRRPDAVFLAAGHGELENSLRELHRRMGLGDGLRLLGLRHDVPRLLAAADVFCLCSRWEGFPNVLVEAMAAARPSVTTDFAGAREIVDDNGSRLALLVDIDADTQMAAAIVDLLSDADQRQALGQAARESVRRRFSWPRLLAELDHLYADFLADTGRDQ
jgi:glycosyltransferase involved in cell wall biosynthesis